MRQLDTNEPYREKKLDGNYRKWCFVKKKKKKKKKNQVETPQNSSLMATCLSSKKLSN